MTIDNFKDYYGAFELRALAYYLVSLFYKTNCKYSCTRSKINRLLTIYMFCNIKNKPNLHDSKFAITKEFMGFYDLAFIIPNTIYYTDLRDMKNNDDKQEIKERFGKVINRYTEYDDKIDESQKELLELIFRKFGSYPITDLSIKTDKIKDNAPIKQKKDNVVNIDEFLLFLNNKENNKLYKNNEIFKFIKNFYNKYKNKVMHPIKSNIDSKEELIEKMKEKCNNLTKIDDDEILYQLSEILAVIEELAKNENKSLKDVKKILKKKRSKQ